MEKLTKTAVKSGRVGGLIYWGKGNGPTLVLFNQWRSGANSILSKFLAEFILKEEVYSSVLYIDRIASGGASDNELSAKERESMRLKGEFQFGGEYANAILGIRKEHKLPDLVLGGSSAGGPAAFAAVKAMSPEQREHVKGLILVEPGGLRNHGLGKNGFASVPHALSRHIVAYRHRVRRGWWTPMDKEQYFAKGTMFEYRAHWWARDFVYQELCKVLADPEFPPIKMVISNTSHVNTKSVRQALRECIRNPHEIIEVTGNHDKICQPPSLSKFYLDGAKTIAKT